MKVPKKWAEQSLSLSRFEQAEDEAFREQAGRADLITETLEREVEDDEHFDDYLDNRYEAYGY